MYYSDFYIDPGLNDLIALTNKLANQNHVRSRSFYSTLKSRPHFSFTPPSINDFIQNIQSNNGNPNEVFEGNINDSPILPNIENVVNDKKCLEQEKILGADKKILSSIPQEIVESQNLLRETERSSRNTNIINNQIDESIADKCNLLFPIQKQGSNQIEDEDEDSKSVDEEEYILQNLLIAKRLLQSEDQWNKAISSEIFLKELKAYNDIPAVAHVITEGPGSSNDMSSQWDPDPILVEAIAAALMSTNQIEAHERRVQREIHRVESDVSRWTLKENADEKMRQTRVKELATKTREARNRLEKARQEKELFFQLRQFKENDRTRSIETNKLASLKLLENPVNATHSNILQHQARRNEIWKERAEAKKLKYNDRLRYHIQSERIRTQREQEFQEKIMLKREKEKSRVLDSGARQELEFRERSATGIRLKEESAEKVLEREKAMIAEKMKALTLRDEIYSFRAKAKLKLKQNELQSKQMLIELRQTRLDRYHELRQKIEFNRPNEVQKIFKDNYFQYDTPISLEVSPGPGEYSWSIKSNSRSCLISRARSNCSRDWEFEYTPGPGDYADSVIKNTYSGHGALPFRGRGKTHIDWIQHYAKKIPGPGSYEIDSLSPIRNNSLMTNREGLKSSISSRSRCRCPSSSPTRIRPKTCPTARSGGDMSLDPNKKKT